MEKEKDDILLKVRSARACIGAGYRLYTGHFKRIFRQTWPAALVFAVINGIYTSIMATGTFGMLTATLGTLCVFIATVVLCSQVYATLRSHREEGAIPYPAKLIAKPDWRVLLRTAAWALFYMVLAAVVCIIVSALTYYAAVRESMVTLGAAYLLALVFLLLMVPLIFSGTHYLTTRDTRLFSLLGSSYRTGLRHWGLLFAVALVTLIVSMAALLLTSLPAFILSIAYLKAHTGLMMGDPLGMPDYMSRLALLVFTVSSFIQAYVLISMLFPSYYACGSIETQEQERNETKNTLY